MRFEGASALVAQMEQDVSEAREILARPSDSSENDPGSWKEIDHTADWAIEITAGSQRALFARAARAMFTLQEADRARPPVLARSIAVNARGADDLMIAWLNALLLQQEIHGEMYTHFGLHEVSDSGLRAVAYGHAGYPVHTAVKAVTYYDLQVKQSKSGWSARVTFDV
jgi:SHS2 domain-containing protein